ncbi:MAG: hypothetical protein JWP78_3266 [Mucilaginibacter sp.]|nr:hypothetical protein [Mucilaginibacter sp.]
MSINAHAVPFSADAKLRPAANSSVYAYYAETTMEGEWNPKFTQIKKGIINPPFYTITD